MRGIFICAVVLCLRCSVCFGQTWSTLPVDLLISMNNSSPGTQLTAAIANAGTVSSTCAVGTSCTWQTPQGGGIFTVGANQAACPSLGPVQMENGGPAYSAQSMNDNSIAHNDLGDHTDLYMDFSGAIAPHNITVLTCITLGPPPQDNGDDWDMVGFFDNSGNYVVLQFNSACPGNGEYGVRLESNPGAVHSACISITPQQTYFFSMNFDTDTAVSTLYVYTPAGTVVGNTTVTGGFATGGHVVDFFIGNNEIGSNSGTTTYFQNFMLDWTNHANPLFWTSGAVQPPTKVTATVMQ